MDNVRNASPGNDRTKEEEEKENEKIRKEFKRDEWKKGSK